MINDPPSPLDRARAWAARQDWRRWAVGLLIVELLLAPWYAHSGDLRFWAGWIDATGGRAFWRPYAVGADYPPVYLYVLTAYAALIRLLGLSPYDRAGLLLLKLPIILAHLAGMALCARGLRKPFGPARANAAAIAYGLCLPLLINAAVWCQIDALLLLVMLASVVAALNGRIAAGAAVAGLALALKPHAVVLAPALAAYLFRHVGWRGLLRAAACAALGWSLAVAPALAAGAARGVAKAYLRVADKYPYRSMYAYNGWYLLDGWQQRHQPPDADWRWDQVRDDRPLIGRFTAKHAGLAAFAAYSLLIMLVVWRRPTPDTLLLALGMNLFAYFMLPTQMHDRYLTLAAGTLALIAFDRPGTFALFLLVTLAAALNQLLALYQHDVSDLWRTATPADRAVTYASVAVALLNLITFLWATLYLWAAGTSAITDRRPTARSSASAAAPPPPHTPGR